VIQAVFYSRYGFHSEGWALEAAAAECAALPPDTSGGNAYSRLLARCTTT
jgi:hypothetical protein